MTATRNRGRHYARLKDAINSVIQNRKKSVGGLAKQLHDWKDGAHSVSSISKSMKSLLSGGNIMEPRAKLIEEFLLAYYPQNLSASPLDECYIDLERFYHISHHEFEVSARRLEGTYQTYAKATSVNEFMIRRGRMDFVFDEDIGCLKVREHQIRPKTEEYIRYEIRWEGYCSPVHDTYSAVLRTEHYNERSTPLHYLFYDVEKKDSQNREVQAMKGYSLGFDPNTTWPSLAAIYLERADDKQIDIDFIEVGQLFNRIREKLGISEDVSTNKA